MTTDMRHLDMLSLQRTAAAERIVNGYRGGAGDLDIFIKAHEAWLHGIAEVRRAVLIVEGGS
jgi:hypothetical protein